MFSALHFELAKKVAQLASCVTEKDLFDLNNMLALLKEWDIGGIIHAGQLMDAGLDAETLLISLKGTLLRKEACNFVLPGGDVTVEQAFGMVTALRDKMVKDLLAHARNKPPPPLVKILKTVVKDLKK